MLFVGADTVKMRDVTVGGQEKEVELKEYEQCTKWFDECSKGTNDFNSWYQNKEDASKEERKVNLRELKKIKYQNCILDIICRD